MKLPGLLYGLTSRQFSSCVEEWIEVQARGIELLTDGLSPSTWGSGLKNIEGFQGRSPPIRRSGLKNKLYIINHNIFVLLELGRSNKK